MSTIDDLAADIREVDGEHKLGAGELAEALAAKGWVKTPVALLQPPLGAYKVGEYVVALKDSTWRDGRISEITPHGIHVETEVGPVTVATSNRIKKVLA